MGNPRFGRMIPAMVTPMKDNLDLDLDRAQELADRLVKGGDVYKRQGSTADRRQRSVAAKHGACRLRGPHSRAARPYHPAGA